MPGVTQLRSKVDPLRVGWDPDGRVPVSPAGADEETEVTQLLTGGDRPEPGQLAPASAHHHMPALAPWTRCQR